MSNESLIPFKKHWAWQNFTEH